MKWADVMMMATLDELRAEIYRDHLHANMGDGVHRTLLLDFKAWRTLLIAGEAAGKS